MEKQIIYKEEVYNLFDQEDVWVQVGLEDRFMKIYEKGYRYVTHYDTNVEDVIYSINSDGTHGIVFLEKMTYDSLPSKAKPNFNKEEPVKCIDDLFNIMKKGNHVIYWKRKDGGNIEINKGGPLAEFCYSAMPSSTILYQIYAAPKEVV